MAIDVEKILTVSAKEWCEMNDKKLNEYEARGVHSDGGMRFRLEGFAKEVPTEAEVVIGYRNTSAASGNSGNIGAVMYSYGTALIPRKK